MICPNCKRILGVNRQHVLDAKAYGVDVIVVPSCCGIAITLKPVLTVKVSTYTGKEKQDHYGNLIKSK